MCPTIQEQTPDYNEAVQQFMKLLGENGQCGQAMDSRTGTAAHLSEQIKSCLRLVLSRRTERLPDSRCIKNSAGTPMAFDKNVRV